jgi:lysophospholipid acyltransferase (LPLAT)-like uncharacterized protein
MAPEGRLNGCSRGPCGSPGSPGEADRYWTARSWDRTQIPRPFSRAAIAIGKPFDVPDPHGDGVVAAHQEALGRILGTLAERAAALLVS